MCRCKQKDDPYICLECNAILLQENDDTHLHAFNDASKHRMVALIAERLLVSPQVEHFQNTHKKRHSFNAQWSEA